ncbi:hypothetical protein [Athalassotoga saccharophila]|uniref:hypothetical protein n=1 Tax=Athalassotoga saccharophila TaxID=1441386 RepID=UPI00137A34DE|nr:hypothetical protein [Athalassotoga saccharophila]BBJ28957.1 hypothetical protein ATHSA_1882 [Athalassotoga saccharophila]
MKKIIFFAILIFPVLTFAVQNTFFLGKNAGGYGAGISENFNAFYLAQDFSISLVGTPSIPLISLDQSEGINFSIPFNGLDFNAKGGIGSSLIFSKNANVMTFWTELRGSLYFNRVGIYTGMVYQFAGFNPITGLQWMKEWINEFGIEYKW